MTRAGSILNFRRLGAGLAALIAAAVLAPSKAEATGCGGDYEAMVRKQNQIIRSWTFKLKQPGQDALFIRWLEHQDRDTALHEEAHRQAGCRWGGKVYYYTYEFRGRRYRLSGCNVPVNGMPLEVRYLAGVAPMFLHGLRISDQDAKVALWSLAKLKERGVDWRSHQLCPVAREVLSGVLAGRPTRAERMQDPRMAAALRWVTGKSGVLAKQVGPSEGAPRGRSHNKSTGGVRVYRQGGR